MTALEAKVREIDPNQIKRVQAHNQSIGLPGHKILHRFWFIYIFGTACFLLFRIFFRVSRQGHRELYQLVCKQPVLVAARHFYEWDAVLMISTLFLPFGFLRPQVAPFTIVGRFWMRTPFFRFFSYCSGMLAVTRGTGKEQSAIVHSRRLLNDPAPKSVFIFPTGPIGDRSDYKLHSGLGHLASSCPDATVVPISLVGIRSVRLRDVLLLRRPRVNILVGDAFVARETTSDAEQIGQAVSERVDREWKRLENGIGVVDETLEDVDTDEILPIPG